MKRPCTHPVIYNGVCAICKQPVSANKPPVVADAQKPADEPGQAAQAQETPKKATRKRTKKPAQD